MCLVHIQGENKYKLLVVNLVGFQVLTALPVKSTVFWVYDGI
jgi:hypothetical protein